MIAAGLLIKVTVVIALTLVGARWMRRSRAAARHVLLAAGFLGLLVLPVASMIGPTVAVPMEIATVIPIEPAISGSIEDDPAAARVAAAVSIGTSSDGSTFSWPSVTTILLDAWLVGSALLLLQIVTGLMQVRALRRTGLPWRDGSVLAASLAADAGIRRRIDLLLHESLTSPMTCGVLRPAIVLPADAANWNDADLRRAIVHELEHVSRLDWLTQGIARVVLACYWFHPMVWLAWRQLAVEAERACDDAVLRRSEATAYADQLVDLAKRMSASAGQPQLAMANRNDLATRVIAVLDSDQRRGRAGALNVTLAIACTALLVLAMSPWRIVAAQPQTAAPPAAVQRFEAASVKPCKAEEDPRAGRGRGTAGGTNASASPGRMFVPCVSLERLIYLAYASYGAREDERLANDDPGSASNSSKVRGGPAWVHSDSDGYSIEATAPGVSERTVLMGSMLRTLLEERFHLKLHREFEETPMFALTVAKSGFKLKPMQEGECDPNRALPPPRAPGEKTPCGLTNSMANGPNAVWTMTGFRVSSLARRLTGTLGRHVIDRTGLTGEYIIRLEFHPDDATPGINWAERDVDQSAPRAASILTALEQQLGLKIESTRGPRGYLVIDHVERPTPN